MEGTCIPRISGARLIIAWAVLSGGVAIGAAMGPEQPAPRSAERPEPEQVTEWISQLGADDFRVREAATRRLLAAGAPVETALRQARERTADAEVRFRLQYVLDNLHPPARAALVVRTGPQHVAEAGDLITHINGRRVYSASDAVRIVGELTMPVRLRLRGPAGPREAGPLSSGELPEIVDYAAPRGPVIARALRLYDAGFAERATTLLATLEEPVPKSELSDLLRSVLLHTAGQATEAYALVADRPEACQPQTALYAWTSPSLLDLAGPQKAPFRLEWKLWQGPSLSLLDPRLDRDDTPVQRVLVPANRFSDAFAAVGELWWKRHRLNLGEQEDRDRVGGNMLAISAWMLSELDLQSECMRLIEPRSLILRRSPQAVHKWLRVQTDAWLAFVRGDRDAAVEMLYEDARRILQPPGPRVQAHLQNPAVAAQVAFFLYSDPNDPRLAEMRNVMAQPEHPALAEYVRWMLYALREENALVIREHLEALRPHADDDLSARFITWGALLDYVLGRTNVATASSATARLTDPREDRPEAWPELIQALGHLRAGEAAAAEQKLEAAAGLPGTRTVMHTTRFVREGHGQRSRAEILGVPPLAAVPLDPADETWLVLARSRRLVVLDAASGTVTPVATPTEPWFPNPATWPWLGSDPVAGRVWVYSLRRVTEVRADGTHGISFNIKTHQIPAFEEVAASSFDTIRDALGAVEPPGGENSEFWRDDLQYGQSYFADPDLHELGLIEPVPHEPRMAHVAFRGGPHVLIDRTDGDQAWTSDWIASQLRLDRPPRFTVEGAREHETPLLFLLSDAGLLRFDAAANTIERLPLPGDEPYPALMPEWCPYERRDPRWILCARTPGDGGQVYRVAVASDEIKEVDMINEGIRPDAHAIESRAARRARLDRVLAQQRMPGLRECVTESVRLVTEYAEETDQ